MYSLILLVKHTVQILQNTEQLPIRILVLFLWDTLEHFSFKKVIEYAVRLGIALNCILENEMNTQEKIIYPDLPKDTK